MTTVSTPPATDEQVEALAGKIFMAGLGAVELYTVYLGIELGLYRALDRRSRQTSAELATETGLAKRYVREWLQSQALSGFLTIDGDDVDSGRFALAPGVRETLIDEVSPAYVGGIPPILPAVGAVTPALVDAFRTGAGVPYRSYGPLAVSVQASLNRPAFENFLVSEWLPQIPDVAARLGDRTAPTAVADLCCGVGWSSIVLAEAYPHITVDGFDNDPDSITGAQRNAEARGVSDRVRFDVRDVSAPLPDQRREYDVMFMFEALHDLPHPVEALANARSELRPGAAFIVMDENAGEDLTAPAGEVERFLAAVSVTWCTPQGHGPDSEVVGAVMRPQALETLARRAGFGSVERLAIEHPFWRFYRLQA